MDHSARRGGSFSAFVFGILVGSLVTLLFTTKKGRKILRVITDEGVERFTKWEDMISAVEQEMDNEDISSSIGEGVEEKIEAVVQEAKENITPIITEVEKKKRRIFKGIRKKAS